jgi:hypothetical protein
MFRSNAAQSSSTGRASDRRRALAWIGFLLLIAGMLAGCSVTGGRTGEEPPREAVKTAAAVSGEVTPTAVEAPPTVSLPTGIPTASPTPTMRPTPQPTATAVPRATPDTIRAKIEVVWPHGEASVRDADQANITAYLISETGNDAPLCDWEPVVRLWAAENSQPARPVAVGQKRMIATGGRRFPAWDFNDVDVSAAREPANKLTFFVTVDGVKTLHNVWVHAADARTIFPQPDIPTGVATRQPAVVDAKIEVVWPHDNLPVDKATLANITGYLFESGTKLAIPPGLDWSPTLRLHHSNNADTETIEAYNSTPIGVSRAVTSENGVRFLAWDFDNIDVSAAQDSLNKIYFWISGDDVVVFPNVWAHGANTPTIFPQTDVLNSCK